MGALPDLTYERAAQARGHLLIAGVDEAGRGPLAGPVSAAAVIIDARRLPAGINDSKRISEADREALHDIILQQAVAVGVALVPASEIDRINIRQATLLAMRRAVQALAVRPDFVLVDGNDLPSLPCPAQTIVDGDALCLSIAAASIVAKVTRDRLMRRVGQECPAYSFEVHKGYGTPLHREAIRRHGACEHHRLSFAPFKNGTI